MDFSYVYGTHKYKQLLKSDVVVFFLDSGLAIRYVSANNDILGAVPGSFAQGVQISKFMPELAAAELRAFIERKDSEAVIEYAFISPRGQNIPVRHYFYSSDIGFGQGTIIRSYAIPLTARIEKATLKIAEHETALRYISIMSILPMGMFAHDGNRIEYANGKLHEMLGYDRGELNGLHPTKLFGGEVNNHLRGGNRFTAMARRKNGSMFAANVYSRDEEPGQAYIVMLKDAADFHSRERADDIFRRIFEFSTDAAVFLDAELNITWINNSFEKLTLYSANEIVGKYVSMLYSGEHTPNFYETIWKTAAADGFYRGVGWMRTNAGKLPVLHSTIAIRNDSGGVLTYLMTFSRAPETLIVLDHVQSPNTDELTGLNTKKHFETLLDEKLVLCRSGKLECAVLMFDIDRLAVVNEMYGADITDMMLKQMASRFEKYLPESTITARESDKFWAIIEEPNALKDMDAFADGLLRVMGKTFYVSDAEIDVFITSTIVFCDDDNVTKEAIYKNLSDSMLVPKLDWQSSYRIYKSNNAVAEKSSIVEELRESIIKNEFLLYYMPIVNTRTQKLVGFETLLRWQRPGMQMVAPGEFIPLAENSGLMPELGEMIFNMACMQLQKWDRKGLSDFSLSINVSSIQLKDEGLGGRLLDIMESYGVDPERIELELSESFAAEEHSHTTQTLNTLVDAGVRVILDDFGTGYSSIKMLKKYPIHSLKIDRSFIKHLPDDKEQCALVSALVAMAHSLDMKVAAVGVETLAQFEHMQVIGCDEVQGYFIGKPLPVEDTEELIRSYDASAFD